MSPAEDGRDRRSPVLVVRPWAAAQACPACDASGRVT
jgi:hypothetical protein